MPTVAERVADAVAPALGDLGLVLHDVEHTGSSIRVLVDRDGGVDVDALTAATREVSRLLDDLDPIDGHYTLEVSSPGLWSGRCAPPPTSPGPSAPRSTSRPCPAPRATAGSPASCATPTTTASPSPCPTAPPEPSATTRSSGPAPPSPGGPPPSRAADAPTAPREDQEGTQMNVDFFEALDVLAQERGISRDTLLSALADALESAYKRLPGANEYAWVTIDPDSGDIRVFAQWLDANGEPEGEEMDVTPENFGRIAAQTAKQVMSQRLREIDREQKYEEYAGREGDIVTGIIQQNDSRYTLLDLGRVEALLPQAEQVPYERPEPGARVKAYIVEVRKTAKGPQIVVSRTHPGLIRRLFELEVPEIADGIVELRACAREPGHRTKIAVWSNDPNVDPVGACVGARGPGPHGRQRAPGREDRHRPVLGGPARLRRQGPVAGEGQGGADRRGDRHRHRHRPRLPAVPRHRQGRAERPASPPA